MAPLEMLLETYVNNVCVDTLVKELEAAWNLCELTVLCFHQGSLIQPGLGVQKQVTW